MSFHYQSAVRSHVGNVRELNEDAYCDHAEQGIWCIADGMGGYEAGEVASNMVVNAVSDAVDKVVAATDLDQKVAGLTAAIQSANTCLTQERTLAPDSGVMGCTVLAVVISGAECACVWAGDSRLYLLRENGLYQLSKDHSVVQELLDKGLIAADERETHPQRHVITRAVGANPELELDFLALDLLPDDVLMLCSDGLYSEIGPDLIMSILSSTEDCDTKASRLLESVLSAAARDNVTVSVIEVEQG